MKSLSSVFRMTNKKPNKESSYVSTSIKPIVLLSEAWQLQEIPTEILKKWLSEASDNLCHLVIHHTKLQIDHLRQQEVSLQRLQKKPQSGDAERGDLQKIFEQMSLDLKELCRLCLAIFGDLYPPPPSFEMAKKLINI
eukprot:GHVL01002251.1.p1 GENE.GHVL01002251.1~~GHVL01002251.1.p1  ORF type:complete len:138 (+),score=33.24 GHVL01002251.1:773-1186(+)